MITYRHTDTTEYIISRLINVDYASRRLKCAYWRWATSALICDVTCRRGNAVRQLPDRRSWCCAADRRSVQWHSRRWASDRWQPHWQLPAPPRPVRHTRVTPADRERPPNSGFCTPVTLILVNQCFRVLQKNHARFVFCVAQVISHKTWSWCDFYTLENFIAVFLKFDSVHRPIFNFYATGLERTCCVLRHFKKYSHYPQKSKWQCFLMNTMLYYFHSLRETFLSWVDFSNEHIIIVSDHNLR